jgi:hypothetical protein
MCQICDLGSLYRLDREYTGLYWSTLGYTGVHWVILEYTGLYWSTLGYTGVHEHSCARYVT